MAWGSPEPRTRVRVGGRGATTNPLASAPVLQEHEQHPHAPLSLLLPTSKVENPKPGIRVWGRKQQLQPPLGGWKITSHVAVHSKEITNPGGKISLCRAALAVAEQQTPTQPLAGASPTSCEDKRRYPVGRSRSQVHGSPAGMGEKLRKLPGKGLVKQPSRLSKEEIKGTTEVSGTGATGAAAAGDGHSGSCCCGRGVSTSENTPLHQCDTPKEASHPPSHI